MRRITVCLVILFGLGISLSGSCFYGYKKGLEEKSAQQVAVSLPVNMIVYDMLKQGNVSDVNDITLIRIQADLSVLDYLLKKGVDMNKFVPDKTKFGGVIERARKACGFGTGKEFSGRWQRSPDCEAGEELDKKEDPILRTQLETR